MEIILEENKLYKMIKILTYGYIYRIYSKNGGGILHSSENKKYIFSRWKRYADGKRKTQYSRIVKEWV